MQLHVIVLLVGWAPSSICYYRTESTLPPPETLLVVIDKLRLSLPASPIGVEADDHILQARRTLGRSQDRIVWEGGRAGGP